MGKASCTPPALPVHFLVLVSHGADEDGPGEGPARGFDGRRDRGGEEDREVCRPPAGDAEAEAQARHEGGEEDHVRQGSEGGGEAREEGGEGIPREDLEKLGLMLLCGSHREVSASTWSAVLGAAFGVVMPGGCCEQDRANYPEGGAVSFCDL